MGLSKGQFVLAWTMTCVLTLVDFVLTVRDPAHWTASCLTVMFFALALSDSHWPLVFQKPRLRETIASFFV